MGGRRTCAACKHRRRKCTIDCPMMKYFPPERTEEFNDVQRLFGYGNMMRIFESVPPESRDTAISSMISESQLRRYDPVSGSVGVINCLLRQINAASQELDAVCRQVEFYRWLEKHEETTVPPLQEAQQPGGGTPVPSPPPSPNLTLGLGYGGSGVGSSSGPYSVLETKDVKPFNQDKRTFTNLRGE